MIAGLIPDRLKEHLRRRAGAVTPPRRLENLRHCGFQPRWIIDAGAHVGAWTRSTHAIFPTASFLLIEPQPSCAEALAQTCAPLPGSTFRQVILSSEPGTRSFLLEATNSRVVDAAAAGAVSIPCDRLETVAREAGFADCDFLKLDLQGHEMEALAGAGELFGRTEVLLVEASWLQIGEVPLVAEIIAACTARGYRLYDIFGFNYRPLDGALWQTDLLFVRQDSRLLADRRWAAR